MRTLLALVSTVALSSVAAAQDTDQQRIQALPLEEALAELARQEGTSVPAEPFRFLVRRSLADLFYPIDLRNPGSPLTDEDTIAAIRAFESQSGGPADGVLTFDEYVRLSRLAFLSRVTPLYPGIGLSVNAYDGVSPSVYASGSWSMPDIAWPLNRSEISCVIETGICEEQAISVSAPSASGSMSDNQTYSVHTHTDRYQIEGWENGILDAVSTTDCRQVRLSINTRTKLVTQVTQDTDPEGCVIPSSGQRLPPIDGLRIATLIDSFEAQEAHQGRIEELIDEVRGPIWRTLSFDQGSR